jgi:hypothetical protein
MRSVRKALCRFMAGGSEAMASTSESVIKLTTTGEKILSIPRTMWRSMTWVVMFAIKIFSWTCDWLDSDCHKIV